MEHPHHIELGSALKRGASFRDALRSGGARTEHLDRAGLVLQAALEKHGDGGHLTAKNFGKVMEEAHKDSRWAGTYSSGEKLEAALKDHLDIKA
jgi:hypothetical protein